MVYAVVITGITYFAAALLEHLLSIWRAPRRAAWLSALVIGTVAPVLIPVWQTASHSSANAPTSITRADPPRLTLPTSRAVTTMPGITATRSAGFDATSVRQRWSRLVEATLPIFWLGAPALLFLLALISYIRLKRQSAAWPAADIDGTCVMVSPDRGPAVFGIWRHFIVIPRWALSLDEEARALMLCHEREHLRAHDPQCLLMGMMAALLFPWNAALWLLVRRLRLAIELDCDDRVLRGHADARAYGSLLLTVCARRSRETAFAVALAERPSMLERRIKAMTAVTPPRRLLISIPLLLTVTILSMAAARTPSPRPPLLGRHNAVRREPRAADNTFLPLLEKASAGPSVHREPAASGAARGRSLRRLASPESLPRVSATWENAPIENVIAAFATFSHRRITIATDVAGFVTATVVDQPWPQALEEIMSRRGLSVEFRADSSVYISRRRDSESRSQEGLGVLPIGRMVSGTVDNAETGAPISKAYINVAGVQLIGAPNEAWSDDRGRFSLRVPDGEVWLDASAPGYEFSRVTLGPTDSIAVVQGRSTGECSSSDTTNASTARRRRLVRDLFYEPFIVIDGKVLSGAKPQATACGQGRSQIGARPD
jgi:beta-lactamase regulating signal transducer with metallopeptidase domain